MEVDQGEGKSRGRKGRSSKGKGKRQGKSKGKGKGRRPGPCLLCQGTHWARDCPSHHGGKGKCVNTFGKGHKNSSPFRQAYLEGDKHDWITSAGAFAISVPSLQNFDSFDLDGKFILDSGATMSLGGVDLLQRIQEMYARDGLRLTAHPVSPLRFSFANGEEDVSTSVLPVPHLHWKVIFYSRVLNAPGPVLLGADVHEDLGLVVDHVDCSVFLCHLKLEDTVERQPSRHLALSLRTEDVKAQYESLTPETRERLNNVLSQKEVDPNTNVSLAHAHGYLKISRNPLLRVYRDVPVKDETAHESEIDLSVEPHPTDEHDGISSTRKRRRLTHTSPVSARSSEYFEEDDVMQVQADCSVTAFAENLDEKRIVVGTIGAAGFESDLLLIVLETSCQPGETEFGRHGHTVQLLEKGDDTAQLSAVFEADDTKTESCQHRTRLGLSAVAEVQRNSSSLGNWQRRNFSSMTKVLSLILTSAQHLDSSRTDCWNRAVRFGRPDLLEVCANSDSPLVEAVESAGGEGL